MAEAAWKEEDVRRAAVNWAGQFINWVAEPNLMIHECLESHLARRTPELIMADLKTAAAIGPDEIKAEILEALHLCGFLIQ